MSKRLMTSEWEDDVRMNVLFSPFRDKNLNPKSWDQKVKFWSELIISHCTECKTSIINVTSLKDIFRRKGKSPACLETVIAEMKRNGQLKTMSDYQSCSNDGWLSWGYSKFVKNPLGWGKQFITGPDTDKAEEDLIVVDIIKMKAEDILGEQSSQGPHNTGLVEYKELRNRFKDLCPIDNEFDIVMQYLSQSKQVAIHESDNKTKLVKFLHQQADEQSEKPQIDEKDMHIHRIQKAHTHVKKQIEEMAKEIECLGQEAVMQKQDGKLKLAISTMRRRRLAVTRLDKLTGSLDNLDDLLYRIKQAESNEMVVRAIEGGASVLRDAMGKTTPEDVANVMDNLADVSQLQDDLTSDMNISTADEPSQLELEEELAAILNAGSTTPKVARNQADKDLEDELADILKEEAQPAGKDLDVSGDLDKLLEDLQLPDVPSTPPSRTMVQKSRTALTS